jgi:hypothetical protein
MGRQKGTEARSCVDSTEGLRARVVAARLKGEITAENAAELLKMPCRTAVCEHCKEQTVVVLTPSVRADDTEAAWFCIYCSLCYMHGTNVRTFWNDYNRGIL